MNDVKTVTKKKKILVLAIPFYGHLNALTSIVYELISNTARSDLEIVFYGCDQVKDLIERSGAEYRPYPYFPLDR
jgi:hypothetical protein